MHVFIKVIVSCFLLFSSFVQASDNNDVEESITKEQMEAFDVIDWGLAFKRMEKLKQTGFHPFLMPLIMKNLDFIELTKEQVQTFLDWRKKNRVPLLHLMNKIIYESNLFQKLSLDPHTSDEVLKTKLATIFKLHKKVLHYQLSCRRVILDSFTEEQWSNFNFVLNENGYETE